MTQWVSGALVGTASIDHDGPSLVCLVEVPKVSTFD